MAFLDHVLQPPSYGWSDINGNLSRPTTPQILREFLLRINIFSDRKNWLPFLSWLKVLCLLPFFLCFALYFINWWTLSFAFIYGMIIMGTHGTIWHHRYCTHHAYRFRNRFWRFFTQNLTINIIPEEIYVISHHVHHYKSDQPGDPYNAEAGFLYCFLADVTHQPIAKNLNEQGYKRVCYLMAHTGVAGNSYQQYQRWGSYANPVRTVLTWVFNWLFWFIVFYLIGGYAMVTCLFGAAAVWAVGVRTFNYEGHGKGKTKHRDGVDFNGDDKSINQLWPGLVAGEWHNNHHLYPKSARSGFKPYQIDLAFYYIKLLSLLGAVSYYTDSKEKFYEKYYRPYKHQKNEPLDKPNLTGFRNK